MRVARGRVRVSTTEGEAALLAAMIAGVLEERGFRLAAVDEAARMYCGRGCRVPVPYTEGDKAVVYVFERGDGDRRIHIVVMVPYSLVAGGERGGEVEGEAPGGDEEPRGVGGRAPLEAR